MKKIIASAVIAAATLSASQAAVFNGASAGLTLGTLTSKTKHSYKVNNIYGSNKVNKTFGAYGVHFDYDRSSCNSFYWGLGYDFMLHSGKATKTVNGLKSTVKYSWSSELDARLGYNFGNTVVAYALAGVRLYKKEFNMNARKTVGGITAVATMRKNSAEFAPTLGLGAKVKVSDKISLGAEYRYAFERTEKLGSQKLKNASHAALAKVSYHF